MTTRVHDWTQYQDNNRKNEWRYRNHIEPLLDPDGTDRVFYDVGASSGYHMNKAQELGYDVIGIDGCKEAIDQSPYLKIIHGDLNYVKPPAAHTTLLSCVHYHQTDEQVNALFHELSYTTAFIILVARKRGNPQSNPSRRHLVSNHLVQHRPIKEIDTKHFYSMLLKNKRVAELNIEDLYKTTRDFESSRPGYEEWVPHFENFIRRCLDDMEYDASDSGLMNWMNHRKMTYRQARLWVYKKLIQDIQKNGLRVALKVKEGRVTDGMHRLVILKELGKNRVICRVGGSG